MTDLDSLIAVIYRAATDPSRWTEVVARLHCIFPWGTTILYGYDNESKCTLGMIQAGLSPELEQKFTSHYSLVSPFGPGIAKAPLGIPRGSLQLCDWSLLSKSEYFNDFMLPRKSGAGVGLVLYRDASRSLILTIDCNYQNRDVIEPQIIAHMNIIAYHMVQSFDLMRRISGQTLNQFSAGQMIELVRAPAFVVDRRCRIVACNRLGESSLTENQAILKAAAQLSFRDSRAQQFMEKAILSITHNQLSGLKSHFLTKGPLGRLLISVCPLAAEAGTPELLWLRTICNNSPIACITLTNVDKEIKAKSTLARQFFDLTPAELKLANALVAGTTLGEYADGNHLSAHTVRNQLKSMFAKTSTSRQVDLILLLNRLDAVNAKTAIHDLNGS